jgi:hypothetical protein
MVSALNLVRKFVWDILGLANFKDKLQVLAQQIIQRVVLQDIQWLLRALCVVQLNTH